MVSTEEILITMMGRDEVTPVANNIQSNVQSTFDQIGQGLNALNRGMMGISSVSGMMMKELGSAKSAMDWVYGTTSKEDTNKVLIKNMGDATLAWEDLYSTVDHVTDSSLTSMQDLIPALNAFRSATQASAIELNDDVTEDMANFGAFVLAQTGSTQLALTAMMDLSKGIKNRFASLDQYGVSAEALKATGLWKGAETKSGNWKGDEKDIKGYMDAVTAVVGSTDELMETNEGLNAQINKMWSRAGKRIGHETLPGLKSLKQMFIELDNEMNGDLSTSILRVAFLIEETQQKMYQFSTIYRGFRDIIEAFNTIRALLFGVNTVQEANSQVISENTNQINANTLALEENMNMRLANAESMGAMDLASMTSSGAMASNTNYTTTDALTDVAMYGGIDAVTSGALGKNRKDAGNLLRELKESEKITKSLTTAQDGYFEGLELYLTTKGRKNEIITDLVNTHGFDKKTATSYVNTMLGTMENELFQQQTKINRLQSLLSDVNKGNLAHLPTSSISKEDIEKVSSMGWNSGAWQGIINANSDERKRASDLLDDLTAEERTGPFRRLSIFLNEKKQRQLPSINTDFGLMRTAQQYKDKVGKGFEALKESFNSTRKGFNEFRKLSTIDKLDDVWDRLKTGLNGIRGGKEVMEETATEMVETAGATGVVATGSQVVGKESVVASEGMVEAETGLTFMGLAEMGLADAFVTLIVPTLAIAGVIAVLIPVIAGLVAEALLFANLVGQFMASLNWNFDLSGIAEKFQELANALAWLGVVMASMTFASILTGITYFATGLGNVKIVFGEAMAMLRDVVTILNQFQYTAQIDPNVATNLNNLSTVLVSVMTAMASLVGVQFMSNIGRIATGFGLFGSLTSTLTQAQKDLQEAINVINQMDFTGIDENKVNTIKTTLEAIGAFCDAFSGLNDIRNTDAIGDFTNWVLSGGIFGASGKTIQQAFESAHKDIVYASEALQSFGDVSGVDETTASNLQNVGNSIKGVADAIGSLRELRDAYNWDDIVGGFLGGIFGGNDIKTVFGQVKTDLETISGELKSFNLSDVPEDLPTKLQNIGNAVNGVSTAINSIQNIPPVKMSDIGTRIRESTGGVQLAINGLSRFNGQTVDENIGTLLTNVNTGVSGVASAIQSALTIPMVDRTVIGARIRNAMDSVQLIINGLGRLKGQSISGDVSATLNKIKTDIDNLKTVLNNTNFSSQGKHMGSSLKSGVTQGMNGLNAKIKAQLQNAVNHSNAYNIGKRMGSKLTQGFKAGLRLLEAVQSKLSEIDLGGMIDSMVSNATQGIEINAGSMDMGIDSVQRYAMLNNKATASRINSLSTMGSGSNIGQTNSNPVNIIVNEGAVQLDARNLTTKESRQIMINALEGLPMINNIDVNGA